MLVNLCLFQVILVSKIGRYADGRYADCIAVDTGGRYAEPLRGAATRSRYADSLTEVSQSGQELPPGIARVARDSAVLVCVCN